MAEPSIVVGTDGSPGGRAAVAEAARLASTFGRRVVAVSAYSNAATTLAPEAMVHAGDRSQDAHDALKLAADTLRSAGVDFDTRAVAGGAADAICDVARLENAETIVIGSVGMRGARRLLGSVPNQVSHKAPCNLLIVRTD